MGDAGFIAQITDPNCLVMDNAPFHKRVDIQQAIREAGHLLEYLPPYSPQLEILFSGYGHRSGCDGVLSVAARWLTGHWAVKVSGNWRLTFVFNGEDAVLVDYQDYH